MTFAYSKLSRNLDLASKQSLAVLCKDWIDFSYESIVHSLSLEKQNYAFFYAYEEKQKNNWLAGLFIFSSSFTTEICFIYTDPEARKNGLAKNLLLRLFEELKIAYPTGHEVFLEVRVSNLAARNLYEALGFKQVGNRKGYYKDGEEALVYSRQI